MIVPFIEANTCTVGVSYLKYVTIHRESFWGFLGAVTPKLMILGASKRFLMSALDET